MSSDRIKALGKRKGKRAKRLREEEGGVKARYEAFRSRAPTQSPGAAFSRCGLWQELHDAGLTASTLLDASLWVSWKGGTSIDYRLPDDGLERLVMVDHRDSRELTSAWRSGDSTKDGPVYGVECCHG
jgi:hypothetical protein